jgi:N-acetylmuramoyl-L-alanine amidase
MCQSFPVKKIRGEDEKIAVKLRNLRTAPIAAFSLLLPLITSLTTSATWAQGSVVPNRITSIQEGRDKTYIELTTEKSAVAARPIIKFLPQDNGDTVMVADFVGLSWQHPTRVFSVGTGFGAHEKGIKVIRAGSFQERPPICRIAITSNDKNLLSRVSFGAGPGKLTVSWPRSPGASGTGSATAVPRVALPRFAPPQRNDEIAQRGESIRRVDFDGSRPAHQRQSSQLALQDTERARQDAELATRAAAIATRRDMELAAPHSAAPLAINTAQEEEPPVAPSHGLALRPEIPNDGYGGLKADAGKLDAGPKFDATPPTAPPKYAATSARAPEVPLQAVAKTLEPTTAAAKPNTSKPTPAKQLASAKPVESATKQGESSTKLLSSAKAENSAKAVESSTKSVENKTAKGKPTKQPVKLASNSTPPPLAPKRAGTRDVTSNGAGADQASDTADGAANDDKAGTPKRKGLLSSLFKKVKQTLALDEPDDADGQDGEQGTSNSQIDEPQPDKLAPAVASSGVPVAPVRSATADKSTATDATKDAEREQPPLVELVQTAAGTTVRVTAAGTSELNFHSFKLQDPPRFVVDFDNLRSLSAAALEQPEKTNKLVSIRVGAPDGSTSTGRLVFDLASPDVTVIPSDQGKPNVVAFTIATSRDSLAGLVPRAGSTVVLDAGHGGTDCGAQRGSVQEKELTLSIAKATQRALQSRGIKVVMTRDSDAFISLQDRVNITNSVNPDLFLSVHINAMESTNTIYGIETYYQNAASQALASSIHESLTTELDAPDRRIRKARFVVINRTEVPAVLAEVGFISNKAERDKLVSADYQEKIASALAKGAILFLNQQAGATKHLAESPRERSSEAGSDKRVDTGVPSVSRVAQKGLSIHQK